MFSSTTEPKSPYHVSRERPESSFLLLLVFSLLAASLVWPSYGEWKISGVPNLAPPRLLKILLLVWLTYRFAWTGLALERVGRRIQTNAAFFIFLLIYEIFQVIAIVFDQNSGTFLHAFIKEEVFSNLLLMFAILLTFRDERDLKTAIEVISIAGLVIGIFVILESILKTNYFSKFVSQGNVGTAFAMLDKTRDLNYRAQGPFSHPLLLATFCAGALPLCWWAASVTTGLRRLVHVSALIALVSAAYFSHTRSGLAAVLFVLAACMLREYVVWLKTCKNSVLAMLSLTFIVSVVTILTIIAFWFVVQVISGRTAEETMSSNARLEMLRVGVPRIFDAPFTGFGPSNAAAQAGFRSQLFGYFIDNYFLELGLRAGLIAVLSYFAMYGYVIFRLMRDWFTPDKTAGTAFLAFAIGGQAYMQVIHASADSIGFLYVLISLAIILNQSYKNPSVARVAGQA